MSMGDALVFVRFLPLCKRIISSAFSDILQTVAPSNGYVFPLCGTVARCDVYSDSSAQSASGGFNTW